jgi:hypothetical protein
MLLLLRLFAVNIGFAASVCVHTQKEATRAVLIAYHAAYTHSFCTGTAIAITILYGASNGYKAYPFQHDPKNHTITLTTGADIVQVIDTGSRSLPFRQTRTEASAYADFGLSFQAPQVLIGYED